MSRIPKIRPLVFRFSASIRAHAPASLRKMLDGIDALVFDIQDVGARFYTYSCTMLYSMEEAAKKHLPFFVLDRPNPITGVHVEGPMLDPDLESFVGCFEIPVRHGMTFGELANMANGERNLGLDLHVIAMRGWDRGDWFDSTGLAWVDPSPNMRSLNAATLYPGVAMLEALQELFGGPRHRCSLRASRRRLDSRPRTRCLSERPLYPRRSGLSDALSAHHLQFRRERPSKACDSWSPIATRSIARGSAWNWAMRLEKLYPGKIPWEENRFLIGNHEVLASWEKRRRSEEQPFRKWRTLSPLSSSGERNICCIGRWQPEPR